uniref:ATP synthase F0 subunit 8 n=1 Tax=Panagrolaimus sp. ES5 TaxID=591445 RepID=A0AC34G4M1_9BILA
MSDGVKYGLTGIGVLVFLLIVGSGIYGIYTWQKSKKNPKPAPSTTVIKDEKPNEKIEITTKLLEKKPERCEESSK